MIDKLFVRVIEHDGEICFSCEQERKGEKVCSWGLYYRKRFY